MGRKEIIWGGKRYVRGDNDLIVNFNFIVDGYWGVVILVMFFVFF